MALGVNILSEFDSRGVEKAIREFSKLETTGEKAQFAIQKAALPAAAALAGLAAAAGLSIKSAIDDQAQQEKLAIALRNTTGATDETIQATEDYLRSLEMTTGFNNNEMRPALESLVRVTGDVGQAQQLLGLAMDVSAGTGAGLTEVSDALAKAQSGNLKSLQALNPALRESIKDGASLDSVFAQLTTTFGGSAVAMGQTTAGQIAILKNQVGELADSFGTALLPIVSSMVPIFQSLASFIERNQTAFLALAGFVATFSAAILVANAALKINAIVTALAALKLQIFGMALTATGIGAIVVAIGLLVAGFMVLIQRTGSVSNAFKAMGNFIIGAFEGVVNRFIGMINTLIGALNFVIRGMQKIGINVEEIGPIAEASFGRLEYAAKNAGDAVDQAAAKVSIFNQNSAKAAGDLVRFNSSINAESRARLASAGALDEYNKKVNDQLRATGGASTAVKTAKEQLNEYTQALRGNFDAQRSMTNATNTRISAEGSLNKAISSTARAQAFFNSVVKGFARDSEQAINATKRFESSQKALRNANIQQRDAVLDLQKAEENLRRLREIGADPESVADAERKLERSKYGVEEANFAVADAEAELAKLRLDPASSAVEIRRAEIRVAEAKLAVTDAVNSVRQAELTLNREINRKATAEQIADAERDLERAKLAVEDSTQAVRDATIEEAVAQSLLNQVLHGATEESEAYKEALDALNKAKDEEADARRNVAQAILDEATAALALRDAIIALNSVSKTTPASVISRGQDIVAGVSTSNPALAALNAVGGTTNNNAAPISVTVNAGMGTDGPGVAKEIIDVLKQYERMNGYIPITSQYQVAI